MAFLQNDGDIILDAVLTDLGRQRMARGDGSFKVSRFALSDDEINYNNWDSSNPNDQSTIESSPIMEAITNNSSTLKSFLVSYPSNNLLYLPVMKLNEKIPATKSIQDTNIAGNGMFFVAVNESTKISLGTELQKEGYIDGSPSTTAPHESYIRVDQGIDNTARPKTTTLPADLTETSYEVIMDSRFLTLHTKNRTAASVSYTDDDGFDYYYVNLSNQTGPFVKRNTSGTSVASGQDVNDEQEVILGSRGTTLEFSLGSSLELSDSDYFFDLLGGGTVQIPASNGTNYDYIDTSVRVKGMTTGYSLDIPVRIIRS